MRQIFFAVLALFMAIPCVAQENAGRPKILGIAYVKLKVTDLRKAQAFYGDELGLASIGAACQGYDNPCYAVNSKQYVELVPLAPGADANGSYLAEIGLATDSARKMRDYLTAHGVSVSEIHSAHHSTYFTTQDPEGNNIAFVQLGNNLSPVVNSKALSNVIFHAGFVVKDAKAESRFYEQLLGFRLYWKGGFKDDGLDWYEIQVPDGNDWLEYMLNIPVTADHQELGVQNHFSLGVVNAKETAARLRANGLKEFDGPEIGRDGKNSLDTYDPDHSRVEMMEYVPTGKPCCSEYSAPHPKPQP